MNCKTREQAIAKLEGQRGVVFQYYKSKRWNWATYMSGIGHDLRRGNIINPDAKAAHYRIAVQNVEWVNG